jgi:Ras-related protein Rab-6A
VAVIVFDITNRDSFQGTQKWIDDVRAERADDVVIMLCGNKTDLAEQRVVSAEEGQMRAQELGSMYIETSARIGYNVKALFRKVAAALPGIDEPSLAANPDLVDVVLDSDSSMSPGGTAAADSANAASDCAC